MTEHLSEWRLPADALAPGRSAKFTLHRNGKAVEGFVINHGRRFYAYVNRCAHVGTPLDMWPNEFFTEDGCHLICATHGAVYLPDTGECIAGPCPGASLTALPVALDGKSLVVTWPEAEP
jgi:nitrite reductase/ring-hydroxylating ferredoxin subunit